MEFKFRSVDQRPPSPTFNYFSDHHAFPGHTVSLITSSSTFPAVSTPPTTLPPLPPSLYWNSDVRLTPDPIQYQDPRCSRRAMIERQLEEERIREEIIAARRRLLEAEVRRELMLEAMATRRAATNGEGLAFGDPFRLDIPRFDPLLRRPFADGRFGFFGSRTPGALDMYRSPLRVPEAVPNDSKPHDPFPPSKPNKKGKLILLAKPDLNVSGVKRKTPPTVGVGELPPFGLKKKPKEEWSCALCQVSSRGEKGLNQHIKGKKHKAREAALRAKRPSKDTSNGKKTAKLSEPKDITAISSSETEAKQVKRLDNNETSNGLHKKMWDIGTSEEEKRKELLMQKVQCVEDLKINDELKMVSDLPVGEEDGKKGKKFKYWCERCKVGAYNPKVMLGHMRGKKHIARHQDLAQNIDPIAAFMASAEAKDAALAEQAHQEIPSVTAMASSGAYGPEVMLGHMCGKKHNARHQDLTQNNDPIAASMASAEAEDAALAEQAHQEIPSATAMASSGDKENNAVQTKESNNTAERVVVDSDLLAAYLVVNQ